jgi:uncharacterized protein YecT (DUF1311 family)
MTEMKHPFIAASLLAFCLALSNPPAKAKSTDFVLVTAPSGDFTLVRKGDGAIWLVPAKNPQEHTVLEGIQSEGKKEGTGEESSTDEVQQPPRCFVSSDEQWIFLEIDTGEDNTTGILYQRTKNPSGGNEPPHYQPALATDFDEMAWQFVCQDRKLRASDIGIEDKNGIWRKSLYFGAWSADSSRLLIGLSGSIGQPKEPEEGGPTQYPSDVSELCYFNTQTSAFELTDRLRKANSTQTDNHSSKTDEHAAEPDAVLSAESVGQEAPEPSVTDRFKKADAELNDIYKKLLNSLSPTEKTRVQTEELAWLKDRDTFATIHAYQSWSPFPNASRIEGMATATEKRVEELRKRKAATANPSAKGKEN